MFLNVKKIAHSLTTPEALRPYASISEQILMSASNMIAALVVVKASGVAQFGIYSFVFVLTTLFNGVFGTVLHRQMMLDIAPGDLEFRRSVFFATLLLNAIFVTIGAALCVLALWLLPWHALDEYRTLIIASAIYIGLYNLFDLFKQYLYSNDLQHYSLRCTAVYVISQLVILGLILTFLSAEHIVSAVYAAFSISLIASLLSNRKCIHDLITARWHSWSYVKEVFVRFFSQSRFSLIGMAVTWVQNQSMNPFLMWISGPQTVGYFSIARLLVMPMAVVCQGLVNSSTPKLRRTFKSDGVELLIIRIRSLVNKNLYFSLAYITMLAIAHFSGLLAKFVPEYNEVVFYLLLWVTILLVTMYRFWIGQFYVVSMRFKFMLYSGLAALAVSLSGMLTAGVLLNNIKLALCFVIVGECVTLAIFLRKRRKIVAGEKSSSN